jgi:hypothetical protein
MHGSKPTCAAIFQENPPHMQALDLAALAAAGLFPADYVAFFSHATLNAFMAAGRPVWRAARQRIQALLAAAEEDGADGALRENEALKATALIPLEKVTMHLPSAIGDYTDFYSSREHATNVGVMFRGKDNALQPNWCVRAERRLPVRRCRRGLPRHRRRQRPRDHRAPPLGRANATLPMQLLVVALAAFVADLHTAPRPSFRATFSLRYCRARPQAAPARGLPRPLLLRGAVGPELQAAVRSAADRG